MSLLDARAPRTDGLAKARGEAVYGVDYEEPGMLWGVLVRSPIPAGTIRAIDTTRASQMPGVVAVVSSTDAPDTRAGWVLQEQRLFADGVVRYEGEPIAAVAAETLAQARAAAAAVEVDLEPLPPVVDLAEALSEDSRPLHPDWQTYRPALGGDYPRRGNIAAEMISDPDGVDEGFARAAQIIEDTFTCQRQYQAYLEPKSAVGIYRDGRYIVHTAHQYPFNVRDRIAQFLGVRPSDVRVIGHVIGGGFGAKLDASLEPFAAFLSQAAAGRPVKLINTRPEDMLVCPVRENAVTTIRSAIDTDGNVLAREFEVLADNGAYSGEMPWLASLPLHLARGVYRCGPTRVTSRLVYTNTTPTGAFRGVNGAYLYHAVERHTDHIADAAGIDRREYRLRHLFTDGEVLLNGQTLHDAGILREGFEAVEAIAPWSSLGSRRPDSNGNGGGQGPGGTRRGVGVAAAWWLTNPMPGTVTLKVNEDGTIGVITAANDNGSGAVSMGVTQIVAKELGVRPEDVVVTMPDTDIAGYDGGSQGSRTTHIVGKASSIAAEEVRRKLKDVAANLLEANPDDLRVVDGKVLVAGTPTKAVTLAEVATAGTWTVGPITGTGSYTTPAPACDPSCASGLLFPAMTTPTYHVHLAEVEVDTVTGNVAVTRYVVAQEVGTVVSDDGVYGQVAGGVAQGIGYALYESLRVGDDGRYRERTLESYRLPLAGDMPRVEFVPLEHPDEAGPFGAKGVGECAVLLPAAVIANAVSDALGKPFNRIPITPEDVLEALHGGA